MILVCSFAKEKEKRKREVGLVIAATFIAHTENKRTAETFDTELSKRRKMFTTFELKHKPKRFFRAFPVLFLFIYLLYLTLVYKIVENNSTNKYQQNQIKI